MQWTHNTDSNIPPSNVTFTLDQNSILMLTAHVSVSKTCVYSFVKILYRMSEIWSGHENVRMDRQTDRQADRWTDI